MTVRTLEMFSLIFVKALPASFKLRYNGIFIRPNACAYECQAESVRKYLDRRYLGVTLVSTQILVTTAYSTVTPVVFLLNEVTYTLLFLNVTVTPSS